MHFGGASEESGRAEAIDGCQLSRIWRPAREWCAGFLISGDEKKIEEKRFNAEEEKRRRRGRTEERRKEGGREEGRKEKSAWEGEDQEIAFAGDDYG